MVGTLAGGKKAAKTNRERHGADFYARIGAKGGKGSCTGGFAANHELARLAGAKGGRNSSRKGIKNGEGKPRNRKKPATKAKVEVKKRKSIFPWRNK